MECPASPAVSIVIESADTDTRIGGLQKDSKTRCVQPQVSSSHKQCDRDSYCDGMVLSTDDLLQIIPTLLRLNRKKKIGISVRVYPESVDREEGDNDNGCTGIMTLEEEEHTEDKRNIHPMKCLDAKMFLMDMVKQIQIQPNHVTLSSNDVSTTEGCSSPTMSSSVSSSHDTEDSLPADDFSKSTSKNNLRLKTDFFIKYLGLLLHDEPLYRVSMGSASSPPSVTYRIWKRGSIATAASTSTYKMLLGDTGLTILTDIHFGGRGQVLPVTTDTIMIPSSSSLFKPVYKKKCLQVSHYLRFSNNAHQQQQGEVFIQLKENLNKFFSDCNKVWVSFFLSHDQKIPFKVYMSYHHEDQVWRANMGSFLEATWIRYEVYADGWSRCCCSKNNNENKSRLLLIHDDCTYDCKPHKNYQVELWRGGGSITDSTKITHISFMSRVIGTYMYLNEYLFTQDLDKQIASCQRQPVRNLKKDILAQQFLAQHKVYVSLTTSPKRIQYIPYVLRSLDLDLVEQIIISLPQRYGRDGSEYVIPQDLLDFPKVHIIRIPVDLGPITKLLPAAEYVQGIDPDSLIVTIDDDVAYPKGMIAEYIHAVVKRDRTVVGMRGFDLSYWKINDFGFPKPQHGRLGRHPQVQILEGFCGIAYPAKYVDVELMKHLSRKDLFPECFVSDDLVISFALALCKIDRVAVNTRFYNIKKICPLRYGFDVDALHQGGGTDMHVVNNPIGLNSLKYKMSFRKLINHTFDFQRLRLKSRNDIV